MPEFDYIFSWNLIALLYSSKEWIFILPYKGKKGFNESTCPWKLKEKSDPPSFGILSLNQ